MDVRVLAERYRRIPGAIRVAAVAAASCALIAIAVLSAFSHDSRTALFATPLHPEQLSEVEERLAEWNVPFGGAADNVTVDSKSRNGILLRLSLAGVPHVHVDSSGEMLARVSALTPQSVIDAQTRSGLAGDLELALRGIDGVQDASVIIAPGKAAVFADEQSADATASVRLRMRPGTRMSAAAISGIRSFVAAGVAGLDERHVMILDDRGIALGTANAQNPDAGDMQMSLQSALDGAFGTGTTIVRVHVEYDDRSQRVHEVRREAASAIPISSEHSDEQYAADGKHYRKSAGTDDRGAATREVDTAFAPGHVARLSVAVAVDAARAQDLYKIRAFTSAAAGLDVRRGDSISVQAV